MATDLRDEIDFHDLLKKPATLFGYAFVYVLVLLVGLGIYYAHQITTVGQNTVPPAVFEDSSAYVQDIPLQRARVLPPLPGISTRHRDGPTGQRSPASIQRLSAESYRTAWPRTTTYLPSIDSR